MASEEKGFERVGMEKLDYFQVEFIRHLAKTGALKFGKFELKNGRKAPYFISLADAMNDGKTAEIISLIYAVGIKEKVGLENFDYIHGPAYKGIPLASLIAAQLFHFYGVNKRCGYDRKEKKQHGDGSDKMIVGDLRDGDRVLIVDDVITSGKTKIDNLKKLQEHKKINPKATIFVGVHRKELSEDDLQIFKENNLEIVSIVDIKQVFNHLFYFGFEKIGRAIISNRTMLFLYGYLVENGNE